MKVEGLGLRVEGFSESGKRTCDILNKLGLILKNFISDVIPTFGYSQLAIDLHERAI